MTEEQTNKKKKRRVPLWMPITGAALVLFGIFVAPAITNSLPEEQLNRNALLSGISFLTIFIGILLFYMSAIWWLTIRLNGRVSARIYRIIEYALIGGIVAGIIFMFQPWVFVLFRYGFYLLLLSTLAYIGWSHVSPAPEEDDFALDVTAEAGG